MTNPTPPPPPPEGGLPPIPPASDGLQFDQAEYEEHPQAGAARCSSCGNEIASQYFEANGNVLCPACKTQLYDQFVGGSAARRLGFATLLGLPAAVISAAAYYFIQKVTGVNAAIATIAMGWFVGAAVRRGAAYRGGAAYQGLAVVLTYLAISLAYVPFFFEAASSATVEEESAYIGSESSATRPAASANDFETTAPVAQAEPAVTVPDSKAPPAADVAANMRADSDGVRSPLLALFMGLVVIFLGGPVFMGMESPISLLIYGFGLYQAWQMNRRPVITMSGPYDINTRQRPTGSVT